MNSFFTRVGQDDYNIEFHTDDKEWFDALQKLCRDAVDGKKPGEVVFTAADVMSRMVAHGQGDSRFQWGETIRYSPSEVYKILTGEE